MLRSGATTGHHHPSRNPYLSASQRAAEFMPSETLTSLRLAGNADGQRFGSYFSPQTPTLTDHIAVELIWVWVPEPHLDLVALPLINSIVATGSQSEQPQDDPQPMNQATR
jgi:hypothetical protein